MSLNRPKVSEATARHIVQRMGETGQPPERGALAVNVGTDEYLKILRTEYLVPIAETGRNSSFKLVQAPFGGGKTQFLHCLREIAWGIGFPSALVGVSPKECPFDDPVKIYGEVARKLELPPGGPDEEPEPGIDIVVRQITLQRVEAFGEPAVREWLDQEVAGSRVESRSYLRAVVRMAKAVLERDDESEEILAAYLRGENVDSSELSAMRLRETLDDSNAFRFLRSLVQVLRTLDLPGVVLLFDEMDRVMSLPVRRKKAIGDNLRQMIDHCGQSTLPALLWTYAVPPEFMTVVVPEYPALEQRLKGASHFSETSPLQPIIDLDHMPMGSTKLFEEIGWRLLELYELGFAHAFDHDIQRENIRALAVAVGQNELETGTRRTFVKNVVDLLGRQHRDGEETLDEASIRRAASGAGSDDFSSMDGEEEFF